MPHTKDVYGIAANLEENAKDTPTLSVQELTQFTAGVPSVFRSQGTACGIILKRIDSRQNSSVPTNRSRGRALGKPGQRLVDLQQRPLSYVDGVGHGSVAVVWQVMLRGQFLQGLSRRQSSASVNVLAAFLQEFAHLRTFGECHQSLVGGRILHNHFGFAVNGQDNSVAGLFEAGDHLSRVALEMT